MQANVFVCHLYFCSRKINSDEIFRFRSRQYEWSNKKIFIWFDQTTFVRYHHVWSKDSSLWFFWLIFSMVISILLIKRLVLTICSTFFRNYRERETKTIIELGGLCFIRWEEQKENRCIPMVVANMKALTVSRIHWQGSGRRHPNDRRFSWWTNNREEAMNSLFSSWEENEQKYKATIASTYVHIMPCLFSHFSHFFFFCIDVWTADKNNVVLLKFSTEY